VADYSDLIDNIAAELMLSGYQCALYSIIISVLQAIQGTERIKWVFDQQRVHENAARTVFQQFTELRCQERLAGVEFVQCEPLTDPADYLAFTVTHHLRDSNSQKSEWCSPILPSASCCGSVVDRETIRNVISSTLNAANRQTLIETGKTAAEIAARYSDKRDIRQAMSRMRAIRGRSPVLTAAFRVFENSHLQTEFVRHYAIGRILGRNQEQALSGLQSGLSRSEQIRLTAAVDAVFAQAG
jgi:hypothetical protein